MTVQPLSKVLGKHGPTHAVEPTEIVTSASLVERLQALFDEIDVAHDDVEGAARATVDAEYAYELAFATARITIEGDDGTAGYKDAKATQSAAEKKRDWGYAKEALRAAKKAEDIALQKVSALQTVAANAREEIRLAGREPNPERTS